MSNSVDEPHPEQGDVIQTQRPADNIDWSQFYDLFMKIEQRLPNFDHMLMAMNDYAFQRTSRQRQTSDLIEFCGVLKKGFFDWYTSSINNEMNQVPNFIDLTNQIFDDDILKKIEKKLVNITSPNTDISESTNTIANKDAGESTSTSADANASESRNISVNTDAIESTNISAYTDASEGTNTSPYTVACKNIDTGANTNDSESASTSASTSANANASESTNTSTNSDASTTISANTYFETSDGTCIHRRAKSSIYAYSVMMKYSKYFYMRTGYRSSSLEDLSQSTETNDDTEPSFKTIMPNMASYNTFLRKRLPVDRNTHLGNDYERHWWRQTNDKIVLNVDISDLAIDIIPNINVVVASVGFQIKVKRHNKWIILISNKFEKSIRKSKWAVTKYMHVIITIKKKEKEFWSKCLVTETREVDTSNLKNHFCSKECIAPKIHTLKFSSNKDECMTNLATFLMHEYGMNEEDLMVPPTTEENPQDSAINMNLSVDPSTGNSLNSDSEDSPDTNESSMDFEVPPNLAG